MKIDCNTLVIHAQIGAMHTVFSSWHWPFNSLLQRQSLYFFFPFTAAGTIWGQINDSRSFILVQITALFELQDAKLYLHITIKPCFKKEGSRTYTNKHTFKFYYRKLLGFTLESKCYPCSLFAKLLHNIQLSAQICVYAWCEECLEVCSLL